MDNENQKKFESVFSKKVRAGKRRTYFFDVRQTKGDDYYLTLTESTRRINGDGYERHKIFLYKEDFNRFQGGLDEAINYIKTDLMPDYDYEEFDRRQAEWEEKRAAMEAGTWVEPTEEGTTTETTTETSSEEEVGEKEIESEDDISW
ncbi:PUR family DNA/RNA-binding protein [Saprospiraceae bacterium]|nr:PUR family DNA/RNA-binding protein [Saprospiraceae bacterium]MDG1435309.1 DUF3276 family protein [Saprospiraceae bacterium]